MRGDLESQEMFTKMSKKLSKKLPHRKEQNISTQSEKDVLIQSTQCVNRKINNLGPILSNRTIAIPITTRNILCHGEAESNAEEARP